MMAHAVHELHFVKEKTEAAMDPTLDAAERANRLVLDEGLTFRDAYRRVAADL